MNKLVLFVIFVGIVLSKRKLIIDTDVATDDLGAILALLINEEPDYEILSILVTGSGEAYC